MSKKNSIGIVGMGFVGSAVYAGFDHPGNVVAAADPKKGTTIEDVLEIDPDVIFVCVPTPMGSGGVVDTSIVESVFEKLKNFRGIPVLKSTVVPSVVKKLVSLHPRFVYNPEFLTEANAVRDFLNPFMHVFGGNPKDTNELVEYYKTSNVQHTDNVHHVTPVEASMIKYGINSFLATKVLFFNQYADLCKEVGADYDMVKMGIGTDPRIGGSHMNVPGHDGRRGAASACFSKDIPGIIVESGGSLSILREAWNRNCDIRNSYGEPLPREVEQHVVFEKI